MGKNRLEAFSDGVIAIIITIMVLELKIPHGAEIGNLQPLIPVFFSSAPRLTPGIPFSTMKAVKCSPSTLAKVM